MGYDLLPAADARDKKKWITQVVRENGLATFVHDPNVPAAYLRGERKAKSKIEPVRWMTHAQVQDAQQTEEPIEDRLSSAAAGLYRMPGLSGARRTREDSFSAILRRF